MLKRTRTALAVAGLAVVFTASATAQQPPMQGPGGGRFGAMQEQFKYTMQLSRMVRHIGQIDQDKRFALTPVQAKKVLAVLTPLRSKPKLTQDQAKATLKSLKDIFTIDQLNAMAAIKDTSQRMGPGGGPGGRGGQGGQPGQGAQGARRHFDLNAMKDRNPFYTKNKSDFPGAADRQKRMDDFFKSLQRKAGTDGKTPAGHAGGHKPAKRG